MSKTTSQIIVNNHDPSSTHQNPTSNHHKRTRIPSSPQGAPPGTGPRHPSELRGAATSVGRIGCCRSANAAVENAAASPWEVPLDVQLGVAITWL